MTASDESELHRSGGPGSPERQMGYRSAVGRAAWGALWVILTVALSALSFWPLGGGTLAVDNALRTVLAPATADNQDDYGLLAMVSLLYIAAILIPLLLLLNQVVARRALPRRAPWVAWPVSLAIIASPLVMEWTDSWPQWLVWVR